MPVFQGEISRYGEVASIAVRYSNYVFIRHSLSLSRSYGPKIIWNCPKLLLRTNSNEWRTESFNLAALINGKICSEVHCLK